MGTLRNLLLIPLLVLACNPKPAAEQDHPQDVLTIEYIAHACFRLAFGQTSILLDPYADRVWLGYDFPPGIEADAVFITHPHYDHDGGIFRGMRPYWMLETSFYQNPTTYDIGDFKVRGLIGKHCDPYGKEFGQMNTIWKIAAGGITLAHWGDNALPTPDILEELKEVDILFIPMDGDYHILTPGEYDSIFQVLAPKMIIPMHYRIPALESNPDGPVDLGDIEPFLKNRPSITIPGQSPYLPKVNHLNGNKITTSKDQLPGQSTYYVLEHSPAVVRPPAN